METEENTHKKS